MLNFRIKECQVLFVQEHKLFLPVASYCHISQKIRIKNQPLFSNSTKLNCSNAAVRHKHTAQFSQSKPSSTHKLSDSISDTRAFQVTAACYCVSHITQNATHRKKYAPRKACDAGAHTKSSATEAYKL